MTTSEEEFLGPEYWVLNYVTTRDLSPQTEQGFRTLNSAVKRISQLQIKHYPATIESINLRRISDIKNLPTEVSQDPNQ